MPLTAITDPPGRLTDVVHRQLRAAILAGDPAPGHQLSVPRLARELDVSRGSVREAVLQLVADGLAEERPRKGVVVVTLGAAETRHIHQVREALEASPAGLAEELDAALDVQDAAIRGADGQGYAETDARFHSLLARACGNPTLATLIERLHTQMQIALVRVAEAPEHRQHGHDELHHVLQAIRRADPDGAEAAMRAHIRRTRAELATRMPGEDA